MNSKLLLKPYELFQNSENLKKSVEKHLPHSTHSFDDFFGIARSTQSFFSNMLRISISSHSGGIYLLFFSVVSSTYVSPLTTRHRSRVLTININPGVNTGVKFPSLNLCESLPHRGIPTLINADTMCQDDVRQNDIRNYPDCIRFLRFLYILNILKQMHK